jgi:hypothetical protein
MLSTLSRNQRLHERKEYVQVKEAKAQETRERRITKIVEKLRQADRLPLTRHGQLTPAQYRLDL